MEGEREDRGESTESGTTSTQVDTLTRGCGEDSAQHVQETTGDNRVDSEACDEVVDPVQEVGEDLCTDVTDTPPQERLTPTTTQDNADGLPSSPLPADEEVTPPSVSSHPSDKQSKPQGSDVLSGQKVSYQTDPRPHFGVAWSSHSTCRPLWGSEGPCWGQRHQDAPNQMHTCPHCHLGLPPDTLRWHEVAKCVLFDGQRNSNA
ncbi:unnamed protein product [Pleuronectes platessa]|uniref:Uncharacterized protein n=1 Tax=Pleuronectes platessa TaxID=8262 RepID=A0A9N7UKB0_PLEPL|nr:unnamed protein product [Pleuronectes platessa]